MKSNKQIQADFKARMRSAGFVHTSVWVHESKVENLKIYLAKLNSGFKK